MDLGFVLDIFDMPEENLTWAAGNTSVSCHQSSDHSQAIVEGSGGDHPGEGREGDETTSYRTQSSAPPPEATLREGRALCGLVRGGCKSFQKECVAIV